MSESNQVALRYVPESTYGTTPVNDVGWLPLCYAGAESLTGRPVYRDSNKICGGSVSRLPQDKILVNTDVRGGVPIEFNAADLDVLIQAAMCGTWTSDVLSVGTTDRSFTVEKEFGDLTNKFIVYTGMRVAQLDLNFVFGQPVTGQVVFAGNGVDADNSASLVGSGSEASPSSNRVYNASSDISSVSFAGSGLTLSSFIVQELSLSINNNMRAQNGLGATAPRNQAKGEATITGRIRALLGDDSFDIYTRALGATDTAIAWTVTDGAKSYAFSFPNTTLEGDAPSSQGKNTDVPVEATFLAKVTTPTITRVP